MNRTVAIRCSLILCIVVALGLAFLGDTRSLVAAQGAGAAADAAKAWTPPDIATVPAGPLGDSIRLGQQVFNDTPKYAARYVGNKLSCTHCHVNGGTVAGGIPMVGLPGIFPMYRDREKEVVTFEERIEQCFQRSENGHRVPNNGPEMTALVAYSQWLSKDQVSGRAFPGRGMPPLPELNGDKERGAVIYVQQCQVCHGANGAGKPPEIPALWGPDSYNEGAGMYGIPKMAQFIRQNMPQTTPGTLTPQQAYDVAAYIHFMPHTPFDIKEHQ
ncbi:MAG: c-type cytochrome [Acidobacteriia bacterium]|nr:c-type cytochrome [Terriglobia bacterium]